MAGAGLASLSGNDLMIWLAVTLIAGGAASAAAGRALAQAWRPFGRAALAAVPLAAGVAFLAYGLFDVAVIPAGRMIDDVGFRDWRGILADCSGFAATFLILLGFAYAGWRVTRARAMRTQYPFEID